VSVFVVIQCLVSIAKKTVADHWAMCCWQHILRRSIRCSRRKCFSMLYSLVKLFISKMKIDIDVYRTPSKHRCLSFPGRRFGAQTLMTLLEDFHLIFYLLYCTPFLSLTKRSFLAIYSGVPYCVYVPVTIF
jgi:hypothetical protein